MQRLRRHRAGEQGSAVLLGGTSLAVAALVLLLVIDLAAYLVAASRAQGAADSAALAAAAVAHPEGRTPGRPRDAAAEVVEAWGAGLVRCDCPRGARRVEVEVDVRVRAIAITRFAGRRVRAEATATLVPPRALEG